MKKFRFFSVLLSISILFAPAVSADFSDMPGDEGLKTSIQHAVANGILSGYEDGTVRSDSNITRAEMASIIVRTFKANTDADISAFSDVFPDDWYYPYFQKAYFMGAFCGDGNGHLIPQSNITFQETFTVLSQVFDLLPPYTRTRDLPDPLPENTIYNPNNIRLYDISALSKYSDYKDIAGWAVVFTAGVVSNIGWNGANLNPNAYITRGQFAVLMDNIVQNYIDEPGAYTEIPTGNTVIRCDGIILNELNTDSDIYIADCISQGGIELKGIKAKRLIIRGCQTPLDENSQPQNSNFGVSVSGDFAELRIIRPYITADITNATYEKLYTAPKTSVNFGFIME